MGKTPKRNLFDEMTIRGTARYAEEEAVSKFLQDLAMETGWNASRSFGCLKKVTGDLVFEIDVHKGARNRDYELVEIQCECNIWHRKFGRTLNPNTLVGNIPLEPGGRRWMPILETGQLQQTEEAVLRLIRSKVMPLQEAFAADPAQAVRDLTERGLLHEYDIHLVLIELCAGEDYVLEVAQAYYDDLPDADKKRIQRHQGGETRIEEAGNLLYIADQMYVRSGLLSWKKDGEPQDVQAEEPRPVREKPYYTSREEQEYMREIRRRIELTLAPLAQEYGFRMTSGRLQRRETVNIFTLEITYAEKGKTLTASLMARPIVLDEVFWSLFDFTDMVQVPASAYVVTETKQNRDLALEDARAEIYAPDDVEHALRDVLHWADSRVAVYEEQLDSVSAFKEQIIGDASQKMNRILCDIYAKHYRDALLSARDMIKRRISGGVAFEGPDGQRKDVLEYAAEYCRKKLYG